MGVYKGLVLGILVGTFLVACGESEVVTTPIQTTSYTRIPTSTPTPTLPPTPTPQGARLSGFEEVFLATDEYHEILVDLEVGDVLNVRFDITAASIGNPDSPTGFAKAGAAVIMAIIDPVGTRINISQTGTGYTETYTIGTGETAEIVAEMDGMHAIGFFSPLKLRVISVSVKYFVISP